MNAHREVWEILPWYVNGTASEPDRARVDAHLAECARCREALRQERIVEQRMRAESGIEYMPNASLKRFQALLDEREAPARAPTQEVEPEPESDRVEENRRKTPRMAVPFKVAAAVLMAVGALGVVSLVRTQAPSNGTARGTGYFTVTSPAPRVHGEVIRAVFSPAITLTELQRILAEAHLRIVSGPSEAGVYSLASDSALPVAEALRMLRQHDVVRFAESTRPLPEPGSQQ